MMETYHGYVRTPADAIKLFEACRIGLLPRVQRRLSEKERQSIRSGSVFVWDEREAGMRRWTDGKSWSASRVSGSFLTYREMEGKRGGGFSGRRGVGKTPDSGRGSDEDQDDGEPDGYRYKADGLMKQSFSITTSNGQHLHLISYYARPQPGEPELMQPVNDSNLRHVVPIKGMYPESSMSEGPSLPAMTRNPMPPAYGAQQGPQIPPPYPPSYMQQGFWPPSPVATPPSYGHGHYAAVPPYGQQPQASQPPQLPPPQHHAHPQMHPYYVSSLHGPHDRPPLPLPQATAMPPRQAPQPQPYPLNPPHHGLPQGPPQGQPQGPPQGPPQGRSHGPRHLSPHQVHVRAPIPVSAPMAVSTEPAIPPHLQAQAREALIDPRLAAPGSNNGRGPQMSLLVPGVSAAPAPVTVPAHADGPYHHAHHHHPATATPPPRALSASPPRSALSEPNGTNGVNGTNGMNGMNGTNGMNGGASSSNNKASLSALLHPTMATAPTSEPNSANPGSSNSAGSSPRAGGTATVGNGGAVAGQKRTLIGNTEDARALGVLDKKFCI